MFNVVVEIKAPEIVEVIRSLIGALVGTRSIEIAPSQTPSIIPVAQPAQQEQAPQTQQQPMQIVYPEQQYPALGYAAPALQQPQQAPMQQMPIQQPLQLQQPQVQQPQQAPLSAVPTTAQTYSLEQLAVAATQLVDAGRRTELVTLLGSFGVQALTALPKEQYGNFATQLRSMGAKI